METLILSVFEHDSREDMGVQARLYGGVVLDDEGNQVHQLVVEVCVDGDTRRAYLGLRDAKMVRSSVSTWLEVIGAEHPEGGKPQ